MPLSFVIISFIVCGCSLLIVPETQNTERTVLWGLLAINMMILSIGIYLALTHKSEPLLITYSSILVAILGLFAYALAKHNELTIKIDNRPQLY